MIDCNNSSHYKESKKAGDVLREENTNGQRGIENEEGGQEEVVPVLARQQKEL